MSKVSEKVSVIAVLLAGVCGLGIATLDLVGKDTSGVVKSPADLTLLMMSLLATSFGIERLTVGRRQAQVLERVQTALLNGVVTRRLDGKQAIYRDGARLTKEAESRIRAVVAVDGTEAKAPVWFAETVASRLKSLERAGKPARFDIVLAVDPKVAPQGYEEAFRSRYEYYWKKGVGHLVIVHVLAQSPCVGMDYLIIDRRHLSIALAPNAGTNALMTALHLEDQPEIVEPFVEWFDQILIPASKRLDPATGARS